ncbi:DUF4336 domain-containing protein [Terricaulis sp.]|uniref:DUF4336 domain-containing protein n=1 Tax=Terricaulis sp. TaxID=2768686 RepID=UPI002AC4BB4E|nr:DUF4336 domain-containing protein [Terricaulis sp.]MDZ4691462.1 DUF4336 domain-containing protein [Terricaulis sp.]
MALLEPFGENIWIASGPNVESVGFHYPTRMAVIRLADGGLFIWSPVALSDELRSEIEALGEVRSLVTPTALHHLALPDWKRAYPDATLYAAPGSRPSRKDIAFDADLTDTAPADWASEIDQVLVRGNLIATEAVFFHRASGTVLFCDLLQNFPPDWFSGVRAVVARLDGMIGVEPATPIKFRLAFVNRTAARVSLARILEWPAAKVLVAHGDPVRADAPASLARAFRWLTR